MGEIEATQLRYFATKIGNDPDLLAEDAYGRKIPPDSGRRPAEFKTFGHILIHRICRAMGYDEFNGMDQDEIKDKIRTRWMEVNEDQAQSAAASGDIVIAASNDINDKAIIAIVFPGGRMVYNGRWLVYCPSVIVVDKAIPTNAGSCFIERPTYYRLGRVQS